MREEPVSRLGLALASALREGLSADGLRLLTREEPALLMASLNLQFREALAWESRSVGGHWETRVHRAAGAGRRDLVERLVQDHRRMDAQLARALRHLNAAELPAAQGLLEAFATGLRLHVRAENDLLAPALSPGAPSGAVETMLREHEELLEQLAAVEAGLGGEAWELETYVAMLSGTLAKHEHREETLLFPAWRAKLAAMEDAARERLEKALALGD